MSEQPGPYGKPAPWGAPPAGAGGPLGYPQPPSNQPASSPYPQGGYPPAGPPPAGLPPADYPQAGYPPPGYPPASLPSAGGPPQTGTNGFAIAALVLGILGVLGAVFGFIALSQIRRTGQGGRGLAIAGIALSGIWVLVIIISVIAIFVTAADRDASGTITEGGSVSATALKVGDCLADLQDSTNVTSLPGVPCSVPHEGEVYAVYDLPDGAYPGQAEVEAQVQSDCSARLDAYAPQTVGDSSIGLYFVYPLEANWATGDHEVVCVATAVSGTTTGSITD